MAPGKKVSGGKNTPSRPPSVFPDPAGEMMAQGPKMLDGKKAASLPPVLPEEEDIDLSSLRARNIMRNNQFVQRLGVRRLADLLQSSCAKKKTAGKSTDKQKALLQGEDVDSSMSPLGQSVKAGSLRPSKRVLAPENLEETMRCTRQRAARQQMSTTSQIETPEVRLEPDLFANQNHCEINNTEQANLTTTTEVQAAMGLNNIEQGNLTLSTEVESMGLNITEQGNLTESRPMDPRGKSMGKQIDTISKGLGTKIPIIVKEGKRRPEAPMQAAKMASESGIIIREHIPILTNWTEYKKDRRQLSELRGKLAGKFAIDINSGPVIAACEDMLRGATRQMRYRLKKKYFDGIPANQVRITSPLKSMSDDQWTKLVEMWSSTQHKERCAKNQLNREKVQFQQRTGSRSYIAQAYVVKQEKYPDTEPTAIDLFKELHCSKSKGFSEPVKKAIVDMEAREALITPSEDRQQAKTYIEAVSKVLPKSNTFLRNVGMQQNASKTATVMKELQAELESKNMQSMVLQQELESLKAQAHASDEKMERQAEEIENLRKMAADTQRFIQQMITFGQGQITPP